MLVQSRGVSRYIGCCVWDLCSEMVPRVCVIKRFTPCCEEPRITKITLPADSRLCGLIRVDLQVETIYYSYQRRTQCSSEVLTCDSCYIIFKHHCPSSTRSSFFSERVVDIWNGLSSHHTDFSSLPRFRRCIHNTIDFSGYLEFV